MDDCSVQPVTQFVRTQLLVDTTWVLSVGRFLPPMGATGERPEFDIKLPLVAPLQIFPSGYLLKSFPQGDTSVSQRGFEIRDFPLLGELPKAIEPHLPVCQCRSQKMVFAYDQVIRHHRSYRPSGRLPRGSLGTATCRFACNCLVLEAWTTNASGHIYSNQTQSDHGIIYYCTPDYHSTSWAAFFASQFVLCLPTKIKKSHSCAIITIHEILPQQNIFCCLIYTTVFDWSKS